MALEDMKSAIEKLEGSIRLLQSTNDKDFFKIGLEGAYGALSSLKVYFPDLQETDEYLKVKEALDSLNSIKRIFSKKEKLKELNEYGNALAAKAMQKYRQMESTYKQTREEPKEEEVKVQPVARLKEYLNILKGLQIQLSAQVGLERPAIDLKKTFDMVLPNLRALILEQYKEREVPERDWEFVRVTEDVYEKLEEVRSIEKPSEEILECLKEYSAELDRFIKNKEKEPFF